MLNDKKNNIQTKNQGIDFSKIYSDIDNAPIHTMQDDLNALKGIPANKDESFTPAFQFEEVKNITPKKPVSAPIYNQEKSQKSQTNYSPFLNPDRNLTDQKQKTENKEKNINSASIPETSQKQKTENKEKNINSASIPETSQKHFSWNRIIITVTILLIFLTIASGGYYFWITRKIQTTPTITENIPSQEEQSETPVIIEPSTKKYSLEKPNILKIDTNNTEISLQNQLITIGQELQEESPEATFVEFVVRDENNNPIDFPIFSVLASLKLDYALKYLENNFSIYFYPSEEGSRIILAIDIKEKNNLKQALLANEKNMIKDLYPLFLGQTIAKNIKTVFVENNNLAYPIRYLNVDPEAKGDLSIDYILTENQLIIATSKKSTLAFIEFLNKTKQNQDNF